MRCLKKIFVPFKHGADIDGIEEGCNHLLSAYDKSCFDFEIIDIIEETEGALIKNVKNLNTIVQTNAHLSNIVKKTKKEGLFPLVIGGDHSIALGSISGISSIINNLGVIWIDAHGDMNTNKTTKSGNVHGMVLSALQGYGHSKLVNISYKGKKIDTENIVIFGVRDLDKEERLFMENLDIKFYEYKDIVVQGFEKTFSDAVNYLKNKTKDIHVSFDLDCMDPIIIPGVSTPVDNGFKIYEAFYMFENLFLNFNITSIDIVEYNPKFDIDNKTLTFFVELINLIENNVKRFNEVI